MKTLYTVSLRGQTPPDNPVDPNLQREIPFVFDFRTLIPLSLREKKFRLRSAFTSHPQTANMGYCEVGINLFNGYSKQQREQGTAPFNFTNPNQFTVIGIAKGNLAEQLLYDTTDCVELTVNYPDIQNFSVFLLTGDPTVEFTADVDFLLILQFEECDEY